MKIEYVEQQYLDVKDFTDEDYRGTGVFDKLMRTLDTHIEREFNSGRLTHAEYGKMYVAMYEANLRIAMELMFKKQSQALELQMLEKNLSKTDKEIELMNAQILKVTEEMKMLPEQLAILKEQVKAAEHERVLMEAKAKTEQANIDGSIIGKNSVMWWQNKVLAAQFMAYHLDGAVKEAKVLVDTWTTRRTTDDATAANGVNRLSDDYVGSAIHRMLEANTKLMTMVDLTNMP